MKEIGEKVGGLLGTLKELGFVSEPEKEPELTCIQELHGALRSLGWPKVRAIRESSTQTSQILAFKCHGMGIELACKAFCELPVLKSSPCPYSLRLGSVMDWVNKNLDYCTVSISGHSAKFGDVPSYEYARHCLNFHELLGDKARDPNKMSEMMRELLCLPQFVNDIEHCGFLGRRLAVLQIPTHVAWDGKFHHSDTHMNLTLGYFMNHPDIPEDAKIIGCFRHHWPATYWIVVESDAFGEYEGDPGEGLPSMSLEWCRDQETGKDDPVFRDVVKTLFPPKIAHVVALAESVEEKKINSSW